jgi:hypothetical protein
MIPYDVLMLVKLQGLLCLYTLTNQALNPKL